MTSLLEQFSEEDSTISKETDYNPNLHQCRNVLCLKEKKTRSKCNKSLKRKHTKYKIRQDGIEDQDILDVSGILESSLTIKSPSEEKSSADLELEQDTPTNYLFTMSKKKQSPIVIAKSEVNMVNGNSVVQLSPTTEEKTQTNAFKLLMDSRNKSLGTNSPGKEKPIDEIQMQILIDKKNNKANRNLVLEKMAESKGSLKKKEAEENQAKYIDKKMKKRADRLKNMISNIQPKASKDVDAKSVPKLQNGRKPLNNLKTEKNEKHSNKLMKTLQLVNMFTEIEEKTSTESKHICKEDEEFLSKLAPSLKKKESVLSYFQKVEKEPDSTVTDSENNVVIKVKIGTKVKKKMKKKMLSLNKGNSNIDVSTCKVETIKPDQKTKNKEFSGCETKKRETPTKIEQITSKERRKRKREMKPHNFDDGAVSSLNILDAAHPRRLAKKPVKYCGDAASSSSDEELHIFTPKKKKHLDYKNNLNKNKIVDISSEDEGKLEQTKKSIPEVKVKRCKVTADKKSVKLAPIFSTKTQLDPAAVEAKQKFLQSGVPEQLKKIILKQADKTIVSNCFLKVVHIQQLDMSELSNAVQLSLIEHNTSLDDHKDPHNCGDLLFKTLLNMNTSPKTLMSSSNIINAQVVLQSLKEKYPRYPVYRTYRLLRGKKKGDYQVGAKYLDVDNSMEILNASIDNQNDNPDQLSWCDKYKPLATSQIIGNFESVKELRKWLVSWTENNIKSNANGNSSDSSDYFQSDGDSKDSMKSSNNLLVLSGPVGSGKTSSVYAIAAELSIKVIEVNASSRRTGKIMLQDLQEATQSHKVNRQASSNENSQKSEITEAPIVITNSVKKRGRPRKNLEIATPIKPIVKKTTYKEKSDNLLSASQDINRTGMSLILIDDADIVFDQDDGFCSAIVQLVHSSKRPVVIITSTLSCPHLQRFIQSSKVLKMNVLLPNILGTWLDIMCLADSGTCWPGIGSKALNIFRGDVRKTINYLQFYVCSQEQALNLGTQPCSHNIDSRINADDENSNISWADRDGEDKNLHDDINETGDSAKNIILRQIHSMQYETPIGLFNIWWSVPKLLSTFDQTECGTTKNKSSKSLESISQVLDSISLCDLFSNNSLRHRRNLTSDPWFSEESHSVSELENFEIYDRHYGTREEITCEIANRAISITQRELGCNRDPILDIPGMSQQRQRDKIVSRHNNLTASLSPHAVLDRKALALDYWPSCRTICRIEKSKTDNNSKRNNRFCHYLKSLNVLCKNDSFDKLATSLDTSEVRTELS